MYLYSPPSKLSFSQILKSLIKIISAMRTNNMARRVNALAPNLQPGFDSWSPRSVRRGPTATDCILF